MTNPVSTDTATPVSAPTDLPPLFQRTRSIGDDEAERRRTAAAVRAALQGDGEGLSYLYSRYSGGIYSYVYSIVRDSEDAADVTQQVFLKLMTALPRYNSERAGFAAWILRVARNAAIDSLRESRTVSSSEADDLVHEEPATAANRDSLRDALAGLTDGQRKVLFLREHVGLSAQEVGQRLGKNEAAVHTLHHRARVAARKHLLEMDVAPATLRSRETAASA